MPRYEFQVKGLLSWRVLKPGEAVEYEHIVWAKFQTATKHYACKKCRSIVPKGSPYCRGTRGPSESRCISCSPIPVRAFERLKGK